MINQFLQVFTHTVQCKPLTLPSGGGVHHKHMEDSSKQDDLMDVVTDFNGKTDNNPLKNGETDSLNGKMDELVFSQLMCFLSKMLHLICN